MGEERSAEEFGSEIAKEEEERERDAEGHAEERIPGHERIAESAGQEAAPGDEGLGPEAAGIRLQREVEDPGEGAEKQGPTGGHKQEQDLVEIRNVSGAEGPGQQHESEHEGGEAGGAPAVAAAEAGVLAGDDATQQHGEQQQRDGDDVGGLLPWGVADGLHAAVPGPGPGQAEVDRAAAKGGGLDAEGIGCAAWEGAGPGLLLVGKGEREPLGLGWGEAVRIEAGGGEEQFPVEGRGVAEESSCWGVTTER